MSMRHHWQELDELLAQIDREERFKKGLFRPGMKPLRAADEPGPAADRTAEPAAAEVIPLTPPQKPESR